MVIDLSFPLVSHVKILRDVFANCGSTPAFPSSLNILSCLRSPVAAPPAGGALDRLDRLREIVRDVLVRSYAAIPESVEIMVLPLSDEAMASLSPAIEHRVAEILEADQTAAAVNGVGVALSRRTDGRGILVILSGHEGYEVSPAEAAAAGILLTALLGAAN